MMEHFCSAGSTSVLPYHAILLQSTYLRCFNLPTIACAQWHLARYDMTEAEKQKLKNMYALRHYERMNGQKGDVDLAEVDAIR